MNLTIIQYEHGFFVTRDDRCCGFRVISCIAVTPTYEAALAAKRLLESA